VLKNKKKKETEKVVVLKNIKKKETEIPVEHITAWVS
jgi:hypothetical protein